MATWHTGWLVCDRENGRVGDAHERPYLQDTRWSQMHHAADSQRTPTVRVLVAFEDLRRLYRDVFVRTIRDLRPALIVRSASLSELGRALLPPRGRLQPAQ